MGEMTLDAHGFDGVTGDCPESVCPQCWAALTRRAVVYHDREWGCAVVRYVVSASVKLGKPSPMFFRAWHRHGRNVGHGVVWLPADRLVADSQLGTLAGRPEVSKDGYEPVEAHRHVIVQNASRARDTEAPLCCLTDAGATVEPIETVLARVHGQHAALVAEQQARDDADAAAHAALRKSEEDRARWYRARADRLGAVAQRLNEHLDLGATVRVTRLLGSGRSAIAIDYRKAILALVRLAMPAFYEALVSEGARDVLVRIGSESAGLSLAFHKDEPFASRALTELLVLLMRNGVDVQLDEESADEFASAAFEAAERAYDEQGRGTTAVG